MKRAYGSPEAFKQALERRLLTDAVPAGQDVNRIRQLVLFDRFLARVFASSDDWLLKGGLVLDLRVARARTTRDVDLRTLGDPELVLTRLQQATLADLGDHLAFQVSEDRDNPTIAGDGVAYGGRRFRVTATLAMRPYGGPFGVDVVIGGPVTGEIQSVSGKPYLAFADIAPAQVRLIPVEQHIAEKLHALTMPRPGPNSRMRDFPDLLLLGAIGPFTAQQLRHAVDVTFTFRATHPVPVSLPPLPNEWADRYVKIAREIALPWIDFDAAEVALREFLNPVLENRVRTWEPKVWRWSP